MDKLLTSRPAIGTRVYLPLFPHHDTFVESDFYPQDKLPKSIAISGSLYGTVIKNTSEETLLEGEVVIHWGLSNRSLQTFCTLTHWAYLQDAASCTMKFHTALKHLISNIAHSIAMAVMDADLVIIDANTKRSCTVKAQKIIAVELQKEKHQLKKHQLTKMTYLSYGSNKDIAHSIAMAVMDAGLVIINANTKRSCTVKAQKIIEAELEKTILPITIEDKKGGRS